jgi:hypothetical protein
MALVAELIADARRITCDAISLLAHEEARAA